MVDPHSIPTEDQLRTAGALQILDSEGKEILFSSLFVDQKTIVVFIRESIIPKIPLITVDDDDETGHFFCGVREHCVDNGLFV